MGLNRNLRQAQRNRNDEFYTRLEDIENELKHYRHHFKDKIVYCNCDDPRVSNFFHFFSYNFEKLGLKKLITTCYQNQQVDLFSQHDSENAIKLEYSGEKDGGNMPMLESIGVEQLKGDGDFRSEECIEILKEADIVVTNPPFSLFREYVAQLIEYDKDFLILGNQNAIAYKEVFPLLKNNKIWLGYNSGSMSFEIPNHAPNKAGVYFDEEGKRLQKFGNIAWYTNLDHNKRHEEIILFRRYNEEDYPMYDNYNAVEVSRVTEIPEDYSGVMGVPITFLNSYNPDQFEILGITDRGNKYGLKTKEYSKEDSPKYSDLNRRSVLKINGEYIPKYARILIKNKMVM